MRALLHRQWAEQQDSKELQQVMRGLKNGFGRRQGAGFLDGDEVSGWAWGVCVGGVRIVWRMQCRPLVW
jgi:hypothetical protein